MLIEFKLKGSIYHCQTKKVFRLPLSNITKSTVDINNIEIIFTNNSFKFVTTFFHSQLMPSLIFEALTKLG